MKIFGIVLDDKNKSKMKFDKDISLLEARKLIENKIDEKFTFLDKEKFEIDDELETDIKILEISVK